jgi:hypothetical protein
MKSKFIITLDVDWVSDEIIKYAADIFREYEIKSTWFITHDSIQTRGLMGSKDIFEIAIHPNFLTGSTQGAGWREVMDYLLGIYPDARIMRTHSLYQSTPLFGFIQENYPRIKLDVSILMPHARGTAACECCFSERFHDRLIYRAPYIWEDDFEMMLPKPNFIFSHNAFRGNDINIINFHPIHIALNSCGMERYRKLKDKHGLGAVRLKEALKFRNNKSNGVEDFLRSILEDKNSEFCHFKDRFKL